MKNLAVALTLAVVAALAFTAMAAPSEVVDPKLLVIDASTLVCPIDPDPLNLICVTKCNNDTDCALPGTRCCEYNNGCKKLCVLPVPPLPTLPTLPPISMCPAIFGGSPTCGVGCWALGSTCPTGTKCCLHLSCGLTCLTV